MPEWVKELITAIGGGAVVLVGVLTIFKTLFVNFSEKTIEASFEKSIEKYRNKISRATRAYEIILEREMRFYERTELIIAELIPLAHDLFYYLKPYEEASGEDGCKAFREHFRRYVEITKTLKNETLIHQAYIPESVFLLSSEVVTKMQKDMHYWHDMAKLLFAGEYEKINYDEGEKVLSDLLMSLSKTEISVKMRLEELSKLS